MSAKQYWFPAKRYGWGWGFPATWQGWLVMFLFVAILVAAGWLFLPQANLLAFLGVVAMDAVFLIVICVRKGEPPSWRWGE